jgi:hypothetical protein
VLVLAAVTVTWAADTGVWVEWALPGPVLVTVACAADFPAGAGASDVTDFAVDATAVPAWRAD